LVDSAHAHSRWGCRTRAAAVHQLVYPTLYQRCELRIRCLQALQCAYESLRVCGRRRCSAYGTAQGAG
jgi:hypothetical protein